MDIKNETNYISLEYPLVHICKSVEILKSIIELGFRFSYCTERLGNSEKMTEIMFPMVSFSDLSWNEAIQRLKSYGDLGIGMKKKWVICNELNPVLYFEQNSALTAMILDGFSELSQVSKNEIKSSIEDNLIGIRHKYYKQTIEIASYSKNFYGPLIRNGEIENETYCFGSEREWRKVLRNEMTEPFITNLNLKHCSNLIANRNYLEFELEDIEFFIVNSDKQENEIKDSLKSKFKGKNGQIETITFHTVNKCNF